MRASRSHHSHARAKDISSARGFTLIELVIVIVLLGVVGGILAPFITKAVEAYAATRARSELVAKGRLALERLAREVRAAVPNSLETLNAGQGIQFVHARGGGRYVDRFDNFGAAFGDNTLRFRKDASATGLYLVGAGLVLGANDILVIASTAPADLKSYPGAAGPAVQLTGLAITNVAPWPAGDGTDQGQIASFAGHRFVVDSPGRHFAIADATLEVGLVGSALHWHRANGLAGYNNSADWSAADPMLIDGVSAVSFDYSPGTPWGSGVLKVDLNLSDTQSGATLRLYQEVHVRNTP